MRPMIVAGMLVLALSASLTAANANSGGRAYCDNVVCLCQSKCVAKGECGFVNNFSAFPREAREYEDCQRRALIRYLTCAARCGPIEGVEHLSLSALRARVKAKEAAQQH
jgi:hypothetical protein